MKLLGVLILGLSIAGCAPQMTLEELEDQAMLSGDWSEVEKRERSMRRIARRNASRNIVCPDGNTAVCEVRFGDTRCACVDRQSVRDVFANF